MNNTMYIAGKLSNGKYFYTEPSSYKELEARMVEVWGKDVHIILLIDTENVQHKFNTTFFQGLKNLLGLGN
jgi:hypothetical protein